MLIEFLSLKDFYMVKPKKITFTEALESVLINVWGGTKDHLDDSLIKKTREALVQIRAIYRFKGEYLKQYPSTINFQYAKNRAGYLAAFGERHAYLAYAHLKIINEIKPEVIPQPEDSKGELVVTLLGAGASIETYGLCYFYNEHTQRLNRLRLNLIEKYDAWKPNRYTVFDKILKGKFRKLNVIPIDIEADLTKECIPNFANHHDNIAKTDILLIYNVMNEITTVHSRTVWKNINFIINICEKPLLVLLVEPSAANASPRINWIKTRLAECSDLIHAEREKVISFDYNPVRINFENTGVGLNDRLFGATIDGSKPQLKTSLTRTLMACRIRPRSPIPMEQVIKQLAALNIRRSKRGYFTGGKKGASPHRTFWDIYPDW